MSAQERTVFKQRTWLAASSLRFFERNASVPMAKLHLPLVQPETVRLLRTTLERVSRDSYYVGVTARDILSDYVTAAVYHEDELLKAEQQIYQAVANAHEFLDGMLRSAEKRISAAGFAAPSVSDAAPLYEVSVASNVVTEYLNLLAKADLYFLQLTFLWQIGELADTPEDAMRAKLNSARNVRQRVTHIMVVTNACYTHLRALCQRVIEERRSRKSQRKLAPSGKLRAGRRPEQLPSDVIIVKLGAARANSERMTSEHAPLDADVTPAASVAGAEIPEASAPSVEPGPDAASDGGVPSDATVAAVANG
jgi:hypothetical protein